MDYRTRIIGIFCVFWLGTAGLRAGEITTTSVDGISIASASVSMSRGILYIYDAAGGDVHRHLANQHPLRYQRARRFRI